MGRSPENIELFNKLRKHAYRNVRFFREKSWDWESYIYASANVIHADMGGPLPAWLVKGVANSVASFTHPDRFFSEESVERFKKKQAERGRRSGEARRKKSEEKRAAAKALRVEGWTIMSIAKELAVGKSSVHRWIHLAEE